MGASERVPRRVSPQGRCRVTLLEPAAVTPTGLGSPSKGLQNPPRGARTSVCHVLLQDGQKKIIISHFFVVFSWFFFFFLFRKAGKHPLLPDYFSPHNGLRLSGFFHGVTDTSRPGTAPGDQSGRWVWGEEHRPCRRGP